MQEKFRGIDFFFGKISKTWAWVLIMLGLTILRVMGLNLKKERIRFDFTYERQGRIFS